MSIETPPSPESLSEFHAPERDDGGTSASDGATALDSDDALVIPHDAPGNRFVRHIHTHGPALPTAETTELSAPTMDPDHASLRHRFKTIMLGEPIPTRFANAERIGKAKALAVLSSDVLSSVAYATEASMAVLITAGAAALSRNLLIGLVVVLLLSIVTFSYRQTIKHYPNGGGSYIVAKENLNIHFGLIAAAALLIDYVLTVSVSVSAGVQALTSAFPTLNGVSVLIGVILIGAIVLINLRGVRDSGTIFAIPTYFFVVSFMVMLLVGIARAIQTGGLLHALPPEATRIQMTDHLSLLLILTAFASGSSAMTGTEAVSNGVPIFKAPQSRNASQTLVTMALLLGIMFAGTTFLAWRFGLTPQLNSQPTLISQMASLFFTGWFGWFYYVFQFSTLLILVLAANTSFADFPRLCSLLARDDYLPHLFSMQGDRLAFNTGIFVLGAFSIELLIQFNGNTDALINLYALGVFTAFTLSQSGMVMRWRREREPGWRRGLTINAVGAFATGLVTIIFAVAKFDHGAWVVVILTPAMYGLFRAIHHHYQMNAQAIKDMPNPVPGIGRHLVVVPIARIDPLAKRGLAYARQLSPHVLALFVDTDGNNAEQIRAQWDDLIKVQRFFLSWPNAPVLGDELDDVAAPGAPLAFPSAMNGPELVIIDSPYRALTRPILNFVDQLAKTYPTDTVTVILPEFVTTNLWEAMLHNQTVLRLKLALLGRPAIVTANVPYRPA